MSGILGLLPGSRILESRIQSLWLCLVACPMPTLRLWAYLTSPPIPCLTMLSMGCCLQDRSFVWGRRKPTFIPCLSHTRLEAMCCPFFPLLWMAEVACTSGYGRWVLKSLQKSKRIETLRGLYWFNWSGSNWKMFYQRMSICKVKSIYRQKK